MISNVKRSEKKQALYDAVNSAPIKVGDTVYVKYNAVNNYVDKTRSHQEVSCEVMEVHDDKLVVRETERSIRYENHTISRDDVVSRQLFFTGENPFDEKSDRIRPIAYTLESIIFSLNILDDKDSTRKYDIKGVPIKELNWDPFVYVNGIKHDYQRGFVWTTRDKQLLVESMYQGIDCGKILVRLRGFAELEALHADGEMQLAFKDLVDGKQRLKTIKDFIECEFEDMHGNFFSDLSNYAQYKFVNHQLFSYAEMPENTKDEDVLHQFLKLNFAGVPQSAEHIEFVRSLYNKM